MNVGKAKDYFSAYYEGSLEKGLKQSFETRLREDAQLQAEYRAFERTMADLQALGHVEIEPPSDLHEKIAARLDKAIWEKKQERSPSLVLSWWKGLAVGALAVAGGLAVFMGTGQHRTPSSEADLAISSAAQPADFTFDAQGRMISLSYPPVNQRTVVIRDSIGQELERMDLDHQGISNKILKNDRSSAQLLSVETENPSSPRTYVALPGTAADQTTSGKGTVKDFVLAVAGHYGKPVVLEAKDAADRETSWSFSTADAFNAADNKSISDLGFSVELRKTGAIFIQKN